MDEIYDVDGKDLHSLFSKNLKRFRNRENISLLNLEVLTGLTHNFIYEIECSKKWVSPKSLSKLALALKVEPYEFFIPEAEDSEKLIGNYIVEEFTDSLQKIVHDFKQQYLETEEEK
jgi:transcriptional regulator with XRE-family HTH domain